MLILCLWGGEWERERSSCDRGWLKSNTRNSTWLNSTMRNLATTLAIILMDPDQVGEEKERREATQMEFARFECLNSSTGRPKEARSDSKGHELDWSIIARPPVLSCFPSNNSNRLVSAIEEHRLSSCYESWLEWSKSERERERSGLNDHLRWSSSWSTRRFVGRQSNRAGITN